METPFEVKNSSEHQNTLLSFSPVSQSPLSKENLNSSLQGS